MRTNENIEKRLVNEISPLTEFLGAERVEDLKDKVCKLILDQVESDLRVQSDYVLIYEKDIRQIAEEAMEEIKAEAKKKIMAKYQSIVDKALEEALK